MKFDCITSEGKVLTIRTFGYHNPDQNNRLFSPQAYVWGRPQHNGSFTISWAKIFLHLDQDIIPCFIDKSCYLPMLTCFHNAQWTASQTSANTVQPSNFTSLQHRLLQFHEKLGHLGFKWLKWVLSTGVLGELGIRCSKPDVLAPPCHACIEGGQQRTPTHGNVKPQAPHHKGVLKKEQLIPGQRVFSDQFMSSVDGKNFTG